jgi:1-deoxy-D-xylulose-5-phosphate reductoisomerase
MKRIAILGSTGSIGRSTLEVINQFPDKFKVIALSANSQIHTLYQQIRRFRPQRVAVTNRDYAAELKNRLNGQISVLHGQESLIKLAADKRVDLVVLSIATSAALRPLLKAIETGKTIALANKEALVMAGRIIMQKAKKNKVRILPIDSEQSAIWQCIDNTGRHKIKKVYLTASGGPFRCLRSSILRKVSRRQVLRHPRWKMGKKITVDSATLMNKGLEVIETMHLFDIEFDKIKVVIHPEAIIHSMVEFMDGSVLAQMSITDMRIPIQYALTYPHRWPSRLKSLDFFKLKKLTFYKPDLNRFPALGLAYKCAREGGSFPCVLNAANEVAVEAFLQGKIDFISIPTIIKKVLNKHRKIENLDLNQILKTDVWARGETKRILGQHLTTR